MKTLGAASFCRFVAFALLVLPFTVKATEIAPRVVGNGVHDDTVGLQALLDSGATEVRFPVPPKCLLISSTLKIHSRQTLVVGRNTVIRLKPHSDQLMLTNDNHDQGNEYISVIGGIWDMDNVNQSLPDYLKPGPTRGKIAGTYAPDKYVGILMRFNNIKHFTLRGLTLRNPVMWGTQLGRLEQFNIEDITFDYNLKTLNQDGIHVHGPAKQGRIANLKGTTNDDLINLAADDGGYYEMSRGAIEDIVVDGIYSTNCWTGVRLLSHGNPVKRVRLQNIYGTYRFNAVSFTNHKVHPGNPSVFEDIAIQGLFASKSGDRMKLDPAKPGAKNLAMIWIDAPAVVSSLTINDYHRTESVWPAYNILIEPDATVESLQLSNITLINRTVAPLDLLTNHGTIGSLAIANARVKADGGSARGAVIANTGQIKQSSLSNVLTDNLTSVPPTTSGREEQITP